MVKYQYFQAITVNPQADLNMYLTFYTKTPVFVKA